MIRVAAVGDLHFGVDSAGTLRPHLDLLPEHADLLVLAGDLTRVGEPEEAAALAAELAEVPVPTLAVLGNHDHHADAAPEVREALEAVGIRILEGDSAVVEIDGATVGVAGTKGFGGGFAGACGSDFGEPEMKAFVAHTKALAELLSAALAGMEVDVRLALLHYAPIKDTLMGEKLEIYPFLGSYLLGQAIDDAGADLVIHGHAHGGTEKGVTPGGVHVRNVAQPVIRHSYRVYCLGDDRAVGAGSPVAL
ncbi:MAG: metallophosphoesterase family protein [Acidimicrobiia bacterium]